jgi:uncharacterized membrane protein YhaH (DUF805 family)
MTGFSYADASDHHASEIRAQIMDWSDLLFAAKGRIGRRGWWIGVAVLVAWVIASFCLLWTLFADGMFRSFFGRLVSLPFNLLTIYVAYNLAAKRFNDRARPIIIAQAVAALWMIKALLDLTGLSGNPWNQNALDTLFLMLGTGIGLWYFIELGCLRGTVGPNAHGEDPVPTT